MILYHQLALALDALKFRQMAAKKRTRRLDKSVKRTAKTAGSDGRERDFNDSISKHRKTRSTKFCRPEIKIGQQQGRHCQMPTLFKAL